MSATTAIHFYADRDMTTKSIQYEELQDFISNKGVTWKSIIKPILIVGRVLQKTLKKCKSNNVVRNRIHNKYETTNLHNKGFQRARTTYTSSHPSTGTRKDYLSSTFFRIRKQNLHHRNVLKENNNM